MYKKKFLSLIFALIMMSNIIILTSCSMNKDQPHSKTKFYFDTTVTITLYGSDQKYLSDCFDLCKKYENLLSNTVKGSDVSKINEAAKTNASIRVSKDTLELIKKGVYYGDLTNGKFDITIGNLSDLWDFSGDEPSIPSAESIQNALNSINYKNIEINEQSVLLKNANSKIDLGGIAKGFIADQIKNYLKSKGVNKGIINLGGNVLLLGSKPDGSNYNIGIQKPFSNDDTSIAIVNTNDKSIVTSGVYERYFYQKDTLYHHILDTKTGYPVNNHLLSVTILSDLSVDGDGLSTSTFTLGLTDGIQFIENIKNVEAVFIDDQEQIHLTSGLEMKGDTITFK